ncbi:RHS repeat-associated core domain-containing protein [Streptomyces sp. NPDC047869]|uniref:scabin-related ADP-ribosyltransferase n=1 Tax=Streptomyces sp. NPDC047869 TaxID=3154709 RepID=UPI003453FAAF
MTTTTDGFQLKTPDAGRILSFDKDGNLVTSTDKQGRSVIYKRDSSGLISSVVTPSGQQADFSYSDSRLSGIKISDGRTISYAYTDGLLSQVIEPDGRKVGYKYDATGRLATVVDGNGKDSLRNSYDSSGRVINQTDAAGSKTTFSYVGKETDVTYPDGGIWTDVYEQNVLMAQYDPFGNKTSYGYTYHLDPVQEIDALGNTTRRKVDGSGRLTAINTPLSGRSWSYNSSGNMWMYTDGNRKRSGYSYDAKNQLASSTDPLSKKTLFTYTDRGQTESVTDPLGKVTRYGYDSASNPVSVEYPDHTIVTRKFDTAGRITSVTDPRGNLSGASSDDFTTTYGYDEAGRLTTTKDPRGNTTRNEYDPVGNLSSVTDASGKTTTYTYDAANRLTAVKDAASHTSVITYDVMGNVASRTDPTGAKTTYVYDKASRLVAMTTPLGNVSGTDPTKYTWTYGYDKVGNQTTVTDPLGNTTKTDYDAEYRPIAVTDPLGHVRKTEYDGEGNVTKTTDALSQTTVHTYDDNGRLLTTTDRSGRTVTYTYDDAGNLATETSPRGGKTTYGYDDNGRLTTKVEPRGNVTGGDPSKYTWSTGYDAAGNIISQKDPYGVQTVSNTYDGDGNLTERADALGKKTIYGYDKLGRLTTVTTPDAGTTVLGYDDLGNLTSRKDANGHTTSYGYDDAGRLNKVTDPMGRTTAFLYDANGNRTKTTNARGQTITSTYDARSLLTKATYSDGTPTVSYTYDKVGHPKTVTDGTGTRTLTYDNEDRPLTITSPGATNPFKYTYNPNGTLSSRTYPDGRAITYAYDDDGRITGQTAGGKTTTYTYDPAGNLTATKLPTTTAVTEARTYDRAGRLASVSQGTGARYFQRDDDGRITADYFKDATTTGLADRYSYDDAGRMIRACTDTSATASCLTSVSGSTYNYDKVGNLTTSSTPTSTRTNTYDAADQLTKRVEGTTTVDYTYDADGNLTKDASGTYVSDPLGQLKSATLGTDTYTFVNDADGNRTTTNKNNALWRTTRWDLAGPLPQIATETNSSGALIADYQYNPDGIAEAQNRSTGTFYMRHDRQNSITAVYDAAGKENYTYTYSAWGVSTGKPSTTDGQTSVFGYTGQYKDPALTSRLYLRDRSYDPGNRRFTSLDPEPAPNDSPNLSPYTYANNDPINQDDPSGRCPLCVSAGIGAAIGAAVDGGIYGWQHRNGGFTWGGFAKSAGEGAITGAIAGALMPGAGNTVARALSLSGGRALATSSAVNAAVGAGFSWAVNEARCQPTTPWDLLFGAAGGASSSLLGPSFKWFKGKIRGGVSETDPFPEIGAPPKALVNPKVVYRGDARDPSLVFKSGFHPKASDGNVDLHQYGLHNTPFAWVGTSVRADLAAMFPQSAKGSTWVYEIDSPGTGINMNKAMGMGYVFRAEKEIVFPQGIDPSRIVRAVRWSWGMPTNEVIENPGYIPR